MVDFNFFPHSCVISRGVTLDPVTGKAKPNVIAEGLACYMEQGVTNLRGDWFQGENVVHLDVMHDIREGDTIEVTLEDGTIYNAKIKQVYPIKDADFGGMDLKLYGKDAADGSDEEA